jgi:hypothetical protein
MNERFRELLLEAREQTAEGKWRAPTDVWVQKFAELIVQECCTIIAPNQEHRDDASWGYIGGAEGVELLDGSVRLIKEHFGVEE